MSIIGNVDEISHSLVLGWAVDQKCFSRNVNISIYVDGVHHVNIIANRYRESLGSLIGDNYSDNHEFFYEFNPPLSVFKNIEVSIKGEKHKEVKIENDKKKLSSFKYNSNTLIPIVITSTGRAGTTMLMRNLIAHPQIIGANRYPYEVKLLAYYASAFRSLVSREDRKNSTNPDHMFVDENRYRIGHNPYNSTGQFKFISNQTKLENLFENIIPTKFANMFRENIEEFYNIIKQDLKKSSASFFIEKGDLDEAAREASRMFFGSIKEILLVRDARDMLCSAKAFWKISSDEAVSMLATTLPRLQEIKNTAKSDLFILRYEDLIRDPEMSYKALYAFLGVEYFSPQTEDKREFMQHRTSDDAIASLDRWRKDLDPSEITMCNNLFTDYAITFGYDVDQTIRNTENLLRFLPGQAGIDELIKVTSKNVSDLQSSVKICPDKTVVALLGSGWSAIENDSVWSCQPTATLNLALPSDGKGALIWLALDVFRTIESHKLQKVQVIVNEIDLGEVNVTGFGVITVALPSFKGRHIQITLKIPDACRPNSLDSEELDDRLLGVSLRQIVFTASENVSVIITPVDPVLNNIKSNKLMLCFESLGENCEFGLVQRRCGSEPIGLFRFASAPYEKLLHALCDRFRGMGDLDKLNIALSDSGSEYMVHDTQFGFTYHAWVLAGEMSPEEIRLREIRRLPLLIRKIIQDLEVGEKIFVYHGMSPLNLDQAQNLLLALRRYGNTTLLWVELADHTNPPGFVEDLGNGLLKGYLDRFAPGENAHDLSLDFWIAICQNAHAIKSNLTARGICGAVI